MVSAVRTHPCRQPSYTKQRQVLAEEEETAASNRQENDCRRTRHGHGLGSYMGWVGSEMFAYEMGWAGFSFQKLIVFSLP